MSSDAEDFPLPPLAPEPSPRRKRELYRAAGAGLKMRPPEGAARPVAPNVLREDVEGINDAIAVEAEACAAQTRPHIDEERRLRQAAARDASIRARQDRIDHAEAISLQRRVPSPIARFLADHEELDGKLTNFEIRRLMQQQALNTVARRNLLTTEKKKAMRSQNYPIEKRGPCERVPTADAPAPPTGAAEARWYHKLGVDGPADFEVPQRTSHSSASL